MNYSCRNVIQLGKKVHKLFGDWRCWCMKFRAQGRIWGSWRRKKEDKITHITIHNTTQHLTKKEEREVCIRKRHAPPLPFPPLAPSFSLCDASNTRQCLNLNSHSLLLSETLAIVTAMEDANLQRLHCSVKNYDWGLPGHVSEVARLHALNSASQLHAEDPFAELWMGTHDSGPSFLASSNRNGNGVSLKAWISENPDVLGDKVLHKWGSDLPFLFKVCALDPLLFLCKWVSRLWHKIVFFFFFCMH